MSARPAILIVEDEPKLARLLEDYLKLDGYECTSIGDGSQALAAFRSLLPVIVLLDVMLPGQDGITICRELRRESTVPILMLTARVDELDRLLGLEVGADDYICKPFSPREVVARVKALLRRDAWSRAGLPGTGLHMDESTMRASYQAHPLDLTPAEFRLLRTLTSRPGHIFSRNQVLDHLHEETRAVTDRAVDSHVRNLRKKLVTATGGVDPIRSVYGVGYAFEWPPSGNAAHNAPPRQI